MRVDRLTIDGGGGATFTLDLHPRLTVVAGIGPAERDSLVGELLGALGGTRPGAHVEVVDDDSDAGGSDGRSDLLARRGLDVAAARALARLSADDLVTTSRRSEVLDRLARLDQARLWAAAEALARAEEGLVAASEALGTTMQDAELIEAVEARHAALEKAIGRFEAVRRATFYLSGVSGIAALPVVVTVGAVGLGLAGLAAVGALASVLAWRHMVRATRAEAEVLSRAGARSYLGFQLQRVNTLLGDDDTRRRLLDVAEERRTAGEAWRALAGALPVGWALAHRQEVVAHRQEIEAAAGLQSRPGQGDLPAEAAPRQADHTEQVTQSLLDRLARVRAAGLPLLADEPLQGIDPALKPTLLELLARSAGDPQILLLTNDEDVASWARLEALTGEVAIIEPTPEHQPRHTIRI